MRIELTSANSPLVLTAADISGSNVLNTAVITIISSGTGNELTFPKCSTIKNNPEVLLIVTDGSLTCKAAEGDIFSNLIGTGTNFEIPSDNAKRFISKVDANANGYWIVSVR